MTAHKTNDGLFFVKFSQVTLGLLALFYVVYIGRGVLIPFIFSVLLVILLNPVVNFLCRHHISRVMAILITLVFMMILLAGLIFFIGSQIMQFRDSLPGLKERFIELFQRFLQWLSENFNLNRKDLNEWAGQLQEDQIQNAPLNLGNTMGTIGDFLISALLVPVYVFLLLFYKLLLLDFLHQVFPRSQEETVAEVLAKTKVLIQHYLLGLMMEALIVATLDSVGLLLIGIEHAVLFGLLAAFFNLIPYIGGIVATALPTAMALTSNQPSDAFLVIGLFAAVQILDNNFLIPRIVASRIKINALVSILAVIVGGALWGIAGMFLALPLTAIAKVIFDVVDPLKPLGFLLGDHLPPPGKIIFKVKPTRKVKS